MSQHIHYKKLKVIYEIIELATKNTGVVHVFVDFFGHVNKFGVFANPVDCDYESCSYEKLLDFGVYLNSKNAFKELNECKANLIDVIAQAKSGREEVA
ncbi:MAG: hypothetical protein ACI9LM_003324 [Alteromonadaceae bacterium]|jgi:hypothetical protein